MPVGRPPLGGYCEAMEWSDFVHRIMGAAVGIPVGLTWLVIYYRIRAPHSHG